MNREFFARKIRSLSDQKILDLLALKNAANQEIIEIATEEAKQREIEVKDMTIVKPVVTEITDAADKSKFVRWNWGAFALAPLWTLANKLDKWAFFAMIPGINILVIFYLGFNGNRIAYPKSNIRNVNDYNLFQKHWSKWGIIALCFLLAGGLLRFVSVS